MSQSIQLIENLSAIASFSNEKVLLVCGQNTWNTHKGVFQNKLKDIPFFHFHHFSSNPDWRDLEKYSDSIFKVNFERIIIIGGGSAIDVGKFFSMFKSKKDVEIFFKTSKTPKPSFIPTTIFPTTAGSGSESTSFAVIYNNSKKFSIAHASLLPKKVFLCSQLLNNTPSKILISSILDAFCQSIESFWSQLGQKDPFVTQIGIQNISSLGGSILELSNAPSLIENSNFRKKVILASNTAGKMINITKTTAPHALSYSLTKEYGLTHGNAVAISLFHFFSLQSHQNSPVILKIIKCLYATFSVNSIEQLTKVWEKTLTNLKMKSFLNSNNPTMAIKTTANDVNIERLENHPIKITNIDIEKILSKVFHS